MIIIWTAVCVHGVGALICLWIPRFRHHVMDSCGIRPQLILSQIFIWCIYLVYHLLTPGGDWYMWVLALSMLALNCRTWRLRQHTVRIHAEMALWDLHMHLGRPPDEL